MTARRATTSTWSTAPEGPARDEGRMPDAFKTGYVAIVMRRGATLRENVERK